MGNTWAVCKSVRRRLRDFCDSADDFFASRRDVSRVAKYALNLGLRYVNGGRQGSITIENMMDVNSRGTRFNISELMFQSDLGKLLLQMF